MQAFRDRNMHNAGVLLAGTVLHRSYHFFHTFPYEEATLVITDPMRVISRPLESLNKAAYIWTVVYNALE